MTKATIIIMILMCVITGLIGGTKATEEVGNLMKGRRGRNFKKSSDRKTLIVAFAALASLLGIFRSPLIAILILLGLSVLGLTNKQGYETAMIYAWLSLPLVANVITHTVVFITNGRWKEIGILVFIAIFFAADFGKLRLLEFYDEDDAEEKMNRYKERLSKKIPLIVAIVATLVFISIEIGAIMKGGI